MASVFITFEGGEGTGKSTQVRLLAGRLKQLNVAHVVTREPGGTQQGEVLRSLLVDGDVANWTPQSEALLNNAARAEHLRLVIRPALERGEIVICDRFMDSTRAYQGYAGACRMAFIDALEQEIVGSTVPDLTLILDIDPAKGLQRAKARSTAAANDNGGKHEFPKEMRFEKKGLAFHTALRDGFLDIARKNPNRCKVVSVDEGIDGVGEQIWSHVEGLIHGH